MLRGLCQVLSVVALVIVSLARPSLAPAQSPLPDEERVEIVRAVLEAEMRRQRRTFENVTHLSTEGIAALAPERFAADFGLTLLTPGEIKERAKDFMGARYLVFEDFKIEGERAVVRLAAATEATPCFGTYHKIRKEFTYRLEKAGEGWRAELAGHPLAYRDFGAKPNNGIQRTRN
jgi:hypothetical protein